MHRRQNPAFDLILLVASVAGCVTTVPWLALPAALVLFAWLPGRSLVRSLGGVDRAAGAGPVAVAASLVFIPVVLTWVYLLTNNRWVIVAAVSVVDLLLIVFSWRRPSAPPSPAPSRRVRLILLALVLWTGGAVFASFWLPYAAGGVTTTRAHDYLKHHAVMCSLGRHPLPLHNVFYAAESNTPYYYYHYAYLVPAAIRTITGNAVSIAFVFGLIAAAEAAVFIVLVFLIARAVLESDRGALLSAACVSVVGGFDILPVALRFLTSGVMVVTLDAWSPVAWRFPNVITQYFWCPQHVLAGVALLLCAYWLWHAPDQKWWVVVAPLAGAALFGSSVHVAIVVFPAAAVFLVVRVIREARMEGGRAGRLLAAIGAMTVIGLLLTGLQAYQCAVMNSRYEGGLTMQWDRFPYAVLGRLVPPGPIANFLDAPWILIVDLGLGALACLFVTRQVWKRLLSNAGTQLLTISAVFGVAACFLIRSDVNKIDYGLRVGGIPAAALAAVVAGALLTPAYVRPSVRWLRWPVIVVGVTTGLSVGLYEVPATAGRRLIERRSAMVDAGALAYLREQTPPDAVVQGDPLRRVDLAALIDRPLGVLDPECPHVVVFQPLDPARMDCAMADVERAFTTNASEVAHELLARWGIEYVLVGRIERERFGSLDQFRDPALFEVVYADDNATVYRLIPGGGPAVDTDVGGSIDDRAPRPAPAE